ncbi:phosphoglycerate dehydrogenase [Mycolicibacterium mucogenicum]|uniref:phosphoglycerate dehydrogenase n=1 Tax=Mycolicibacterium mucogenicum TaxID=56689 RepID=UPI00226AD921|nr:phosphoglycerate dehydrogenase [Mycolicibacterium mucogenicum]MCX8562879.1 phosphoglycerate dehydrogenase [Mycolicibacterium mucogenicum]
MSRVLVTTDYLVPGDEVDALLRRHGHQAIYRPAAGPRHREDARTLFDGVHGAITASEPITTDMMATATELQVIARSGVGYDSIDLGAATARGIRVCNTPGVNHDAVAEMTIALMLMAARRLTEVVDGVRAGRWPRAAGRELRGNTLGIIGFGPSGRAVANLASAFGMAVLVHTAYPDTTAPGVRFVDRATVIGSADYLSLHTKTDDRTERMIDVSALEAMKPTAVLINTARGALVDEHALAEALDAGEIAGAALDVLDAEPLPPDSRLRGRDNVIITSHLAGQTVEARLRAGLCAAADVIAVLDGREPRHPVN